MTTPQSLPAWLYTDRRFFELEREKIFHQAWHIMGHVNDAPNPGDYLTLDMLGERPSRKLVRATVQPCQGAGGSANLARGIKIERALQGSYHDPPFRF